MNDYTVPQAAHRLELDGRESLTVSGVEDVERFDESPLPLRPAPVFVFACAVLLRCVGGLGGGCNEKRPCQFWQERG